MTQLNSKEITEIIEKEAEAYASRHATRGTYKWELIKNAYVHGAAFTLTKINEVTK